jgi:2-C-methyl-D-erythritol 4-phosphate cytidylyltransferase
VAPPEDAVTIVLAAGIGSRVAGDAPKQFLDLNGAPVLRHTLSHLIDCPRVVVVHHPDHLDRTREIVEQAALVQPVSLTPGGSTRRESISAALASVADIRDEAPLVLQNAASPNTPAWLVHQCLDALERYDVVQAYIPAVHTIFRRAGNELVETLDRNSLGYSVDPTVYRLGCLRRIATVQDAVAGEMTLDTARFLGTTVGLLASPASNVKLTTPHDLLLLRALTAGSGYAASR